MGNPVRRDYNAATAIPGPQSPINLDFLPLSSTTFAVAIADGTASYSVELTLDDVNDPPPGGVIWFPHKDFPAGTAASKYGELFTPWRWARINIASLTGTVVFYCSQTLDASGSY